mmetsp:Transcript_37476/g.54862  ORF Transcript_37476/g.54862 Transcript_37476/m.54862 type:complete len:86 (-) Transcript_37476:451-708(-)
MIPSLRLVFKNRWRKVAATSAESMGEARPFLIGSSPLLRGRKAPPQPAIAPHAIGPKTGKGKMLAGILEPAASVKVTTTLARRVS